MPSGRSAFARITLTLAFVSGCGASLPMDLPDVTARHPYARSSEVQLAEPTNQYSWLRLHDLEADDPLLFTALQEFRTASRVECTTVGNGTVGGQFRAGQILLDRTDAPELVAWIAPRATLEGRIALLNVLACTHPNAAGAERDALLREFGDQHVTYVCGCTPDELTVASLIDAPPVCGELP